MNQLANFVWGIADQLRGVYRPAQYGTAMLPFVILRRMECVLAEHDEAIEKARASSPNDMVLGARLRRLGLHYYNTSPYTLAKLLGAPGDLADNLIDYVSGFSESVADIFERFGFAKTIAKLDEKDRLYLVVDQFSDVDLHPDRVSNAEMGQVFEHLIYKFSTASNETAGEHFTPRDAIHLMVDLLLAPDDEVLTGDGVVRRIYDPTAGTGGMLSVAEETIHDFNELAQVTLSGQELNDESYAICKSDMIAKGQSVDSIQQGDTLRNDKFAGKTFDYCLSNPPYGGDWKSAEDIVRAEHKRGGGRFDAGLPRISDGQMLFLQHLVSKMQPAVAGDDRTGGRAGIVLNGSPLFTGGAESGESEIRRWLLTSDLVDAIVALPNNMFYNTGIATYIWILDNHKPEHRRGKIQLIDARKRWTKLHKSLGDKNREISEADRAAIVKVYEAFEDTDESKLLTADDFGYHEITVEQPLQLRFEVTDDSVTAVTATRQFGKLDEIEKEAVLSGLESLRGHVWMDREEFVPALRKASNNAGFALPGSLVKALWQTIGLHDKDAVICRDRNGDPEPNPELRDTELVPLDRNIDEYFNLEITPYVPLSWIDHAKTRTGYEILFSRHFTTESESVDPALLNGAFECANTEASQLVDEVTTLAGELTRLAVENGWPTVPLRRVARIRNGGTPSPDESNWDGPHLWATPVDINHSDGNLRSTSRRVTTEGLKATRLAPAGSVLVSSRAPIGSVAVLATQSSFNQGCKAVIPNLDIITSHCLAFQLMASKNFMESLGQGTTFPEINADRLATVPVLVPPLEVQNATDFAGAIAKFHRARRLFESLVDQARTRRRSLDSLIARGAAHGIQLGSNAR